MSNLHPDRESYVVIWEKVIHPEIRNYQKKYPGCFDLMPDAKEAIWEKYVKLNSYSKLNYMKYPEGRLDRHKVAACYMIAIIMVSPMSIKADAPLPCLALNEGLAITVGLSLVRAFTISAINRNSDLKNEEKDQLIQKFNNGIKIPDGELVNHGKYLENFANELSFAAFEGKLNVIALAHELFLLEVLTRI